MRGLKLLAVVVLAVLIISACQLKPAQLEKGYQDPLSSATKYEIVHIEGMPCVLVHGYHRAGLSCDWSQWQEEER